MENILLANLPMIFPMAKDIFFKKMGILFMDFGKMVF